MIIIRIITMAILIINIRILIKVIYIFVITMCNALSMKPQTTPNLSSQIICESLSCCLSVCFLYKSLSCSLSVCFLYNILALNFWVKGNYPQKETFMNYDIMQQFYPDVNIQHCLLKVIFIKKMKIIPLMIESIAVDGCFSVASFYLFTSRVHSRKEPQPLCHIASDSNF